MSKYTNCHQWNNGKTLQQNPVGMHSTLPNNLTAQNTLTRDGCFLTWLRHKSGRVQRNAQRPTQKHNQQARTKQRGSSKRSRFSIANLDYLEVEETPNKQLKGLLSKRHELQENTENSWIAIIKDVSEKSNEEVLLKKNHGNLGSEKKSNKGLCKVSQTDRIGKGILRLEDKGSLTRTPTTQ